MREISLTNLHKKKWIAERLKEIPVFPKCSQILHVSSEEQYADELFKVLKDIAILQDYLPLIRQYLSDCKNIFINLWGKSDSWPQSARSFTDEIQNLSDSIQFFLDNTHENYVNRYLQLQPVLQRIKDIEANQFILEIEKELVLNEKIELRKNAYKLLEPPQLPAQIKHIDQKLLRDRQFLEYFDQYLQSLNSYHNNFKKIIKNQFGENDSLWPTWVKRHDKNIEQLQLAIQLYLKDTSKKHSTFLKKFQKSVSLITDSSVSDLYLNELKTKLILEVNRFSHPLLLGKIELTGKLKIHIQTILNQVQLWIEESILCQLPVMEKNLKLFQSQLKNLNTNFVEISKIELTKIQMIYLYALLGYVSYSHLPDSVSAIQMTPLQLQHILVFKLDEFLDGGFINSAILSSRNRSEYMNCINNDGELVLSILNLAFTRPITISTSILSSFIELGFDPLNSIGQNKATYLSDFIDHSNVQATKSLLYIGYYYKPEWYSERLNRDIENRISDSQHANFLLNTVIYDAKQGNFDKAVETYSKALDANIKEVIQFVENWQTVAVNDPEATIYHPFATAVELLPFLSASFRLVQSNVDIRLYLKFNFLLAEYLLSENCCYSSEDSQDAQYYAILFLNKIKNYILTETLSTSDVEFLLPQKKAASRLIISCYRKLLKLKDTAELCADIAEVVNENPRDFDLCEARLFQRRIILKYNNRVFENLSKIVDEIENYFDGYNIIWPLEKKFDLDRIADYSKNRLLIKNDLVENYLKPQLHQEINNKEIVLHAGSFIFNIIYEGNQKALDLIKKYGTFSQQKNGRCVFNAMQTESSPLHEAILLSFSEDGVIDLIMQNYYTSAMNIFGDPSIHYAVFHNRLNIVKRILVHDPDALESKDQGGNTPLQVAVQNNNHEIYTALKALKANMYCLNEKKQNLLHLAMNRSYRDDDPILNDLIDNHPELLVKADENKKIPLEYIKFEEPYILHKALEYLIVNFQQLHSELIDWVPSGEKLLVSLKSKYLFLREGLSSSSIPLDEPKLICLLCFCGSEQAKECLLLYLIAILRQNHDASLHFFYLFRTIDKLIKTQHIQELSQKVAMAQAIHQLFTKLSSIRFDYAKNAKQKLWDEEFQKFVRNIPDKMIEFAFKLIILSSLDLINNENMCILLNRISSQKEEIISRCTVDLKNYVIASKQPISSRIANFIAGINFNFISIYTDYQKQLAPQSLRFLLNIHEKTYCLHVMAFLGDLKQIQNHLETGKNSQECISGSINATDNEGKTPLYYAALNSQWQTFTYLLRENAQFRLTNHHVDGVRNPENVKNDVELITALLESHTTVFSETKKDIATIYEQFLTYNDQYAQSILVELFIPRKEAQPFIELRKYAMAVLTCETLENLLTRHIKNTTVSKGIYLNLDFQNHNVEYPVAKLYTCIKKFSPKDTLLECQKFADEYLNYQKSIRFKIFKTSSSEFLQKISKICKPYQYDHAVLIEIYNELSSLNNEMEENLSKRYQK